MEQWKKSYLEKQELCDILMPYYFSTAQRKAGLLPAAASSSAGAAGAAVSRGCSTILPGLGTAASSVCLLHPSVGTVGREGARGVGAWHRPAEPIGLTWPWPKCCPFLRLRIQQPPRSRGRQEPCRMIKAFGTCTLLKINLCGREENLLPGAWEEASALQSPARAAPRVQGSGQGPAES